MIPKEDFLKAYNKYSASKIEKFYFRYFSEETTPRDKWLSKYTGGIFIGLFLLGLIGNIIKILSFLIKPASIILAISFTIFAIIWIYTWVKHSLRIKKICKELNVNKEEYEKLVDLYFD